MFTSKTTALPDTLPTPVHDPRSNGLADNAALHADHAIDAARNVANGALDSMHDGVQTLRNGATPMFNRVADKASSIGHRSWDAVQEGSQRLRSQARHASESTATYVRDEPVKAVLMAAAGGAVLMAVASWLARSRRSH